MPICDTVGIARMKPDDSSGRPYDRNLGGDLGLLHFRSPALLNDDVRPDALSIAAIRRSA